MAEIKSEQNIRFANILKLLKERGHSQRKIIDTIKLDFVNDETYFSNLKSGKRKTIPDQLITALHHHYKVNPDYLKLLSDRPFDDIEYKLENFLHFVDDWNVLERENDKYLHLTLDRNFYDMLLELHHIKEVTEEGIFSYENEKNSVKELYSGSPSPEEFVLIPRNVFWDIVKSDSEKAKYVNEILDFTKFDSYLNDK